ncbi:MAG TPA: TetR/AcrR family transcriptional regulator [Roseiflexaceae bacterium]|nr:TetR/AcrR family transcriptional regulator [Roseiflexaceae bacterium]
MPKLLETTRVAREARILRAAVACFARQGYYGTTMEEIAAEAGIAKGAAYVYFPSKEAIFLALYDTWGCALREEIMAALARLTPSEQASVRRVLRTIVEVTGQHVQAEAATCRVLMEGWTLAAYVPAIAERVAAEQAQGQTQLTALIQDGVAAGEWPPDFDAALHATMVRATIHGLMASWHIASESFSWDAAAAALAAW